MITLIRMHNPQWLKLFGTAWETMTKNDSNIGAFLINHNDESVCMDSNAARIASITELTYHNATAALEHMQNDNKITLIFAEDNENLSAGYIRLTPSDNSSLPVCSQSDLIMEMRCCDTPSMLALIQLEEKGNPSLSDFHIFSAISAIKSAAPTNTLISKYSANRFWLFVPEFSGNQKIFLQMLQKAVSECTLTDDMDTADNDHHMTFSAGCGADLPQPSQRMHTAEFSLFEAASMGIGSICLYSVERYKNQKNEYNNMKRFSDLIENNRFIYHFQPIVSARTGDVMAYEALMRTSSSIGMYPLEILDCALKYDRMYDIERATMRNTLSYISENQDNFKNKKLFVNSITAHILNEDDWILLEQEYGELLEKMVIELTEQSEIDDDRLELIKERLKRNNMNLAIDDYGTGYSNTSNLVRYSPNYVKIDRSLITGIESQPKMQKFVSSIIEFVHANGYLALAEGVETSEGLRTMIKLSVDLIQGYYISKPKPVPVHEISENLIAEIRKINIDYSDTINMIYHPEKGETVVLQKIVDEKYSSIFIDSEDITIEGGSVPTNISIIIQDELKTKIKLHNVDIINEKDEPIISLGTNTNAEFVIEGKCRLTGCGFYVPLTASINISGSGSLFIKSESNSAYCIGVNKDQSPGNIVITMDGTLTAEANGDHAVVIGGGKNDGGTAIRILGGSLVLSCSGNTSVGVGNINGNSVIDLSECSYSFCCNSSNAIAIGSVSGNAEICMNNFNANISCSGLNLCGIGTISSGSGHIFMSSGQANFIMRGRTVDCIGTSKGNLDCNIEFSKISIDCEGSTAACIGDIKGDGDICIKDSEVNAIVHANEPFSLGSRNGLLSLSNCMQNIKIN